VSKIIVDNTTIFKHYNQLFGNFKSQQFKMLFDKIAFIYFIRKKYSNILALEMASQEYGHCANYINAFSLPTVVSCF